MERRTVFCATALFELFAHKPTEVAARNCRPEARPKSHHRRDSGINVGDPMPMPSDQSSWRPRAVPPKEYRANLQLPENARNPGSRWDGRTTKQPILSYVAGNTQSPNPAALRPPPFHFRLESNAVLIAGP